MGDNRDIAILFWMTILLIVAFLAPELRKHATEVVRRFLAPKLLLALVSYLAFIGGVVYLAEKVGLWSPDLTAKTAIWFIIAGMALFFGSTEAGKKIGFFKKITLGTVGFGAFFEFLINAKSFGLIFELLLQPLIFGLAAVGLAGMRVEGGRILIRSSEASLALIGMGLLLATVNDWIKNWGQLQFDAILRTLLLPIWLTFSCLIFVYFLALIMSYGQAFSMMRHKVQPDRPNLRARLGFILAANFRLRSLNSLSWHQLKIVGLEKLFLAAFRRSREVLRQQ